MRAQRPSNKRTRRLYVAFCVSSVLLVLCFWYAAYPHSALEELAGMARLGKPEDNMLGFELHACLESGEIIVPAGFRDPCEDGESAHYLSTHLTGYFFCPKDTEGYLSRSPIFNTAITVKPRIEITPIYTDDIRLALKVAKHLNLTVTVRDGGHNPAGFSVSEGGLVIDMAYFNRVRFIDEAPFHDCAMDWTIEFPVNSIVAQGGSRWKDIHVLFEERNVSAVGGGCSTVGVVGLALGGGIGWNSRYRGLVSDNVLAIRIVLPDGSVETVDDVSDPDMMWALRGAGGSNFGVVTEVVMKTYPARDTYLAGTFRLTRSPQEAILLLDSYGECMINSDLDPRLTVDIFIDRDISHRHMADIKIRVSIGLLFDGPIDEGVEVLQPFLEQLSHQLTAAEACKLSKTECASPDEIKNAKHQIHDWIMKGGPFLNEYSFTQWAKQYGVKTASVHWTNGFVDGWTKELSIAMIDSFRYAGIDFVPAGMTGVLSLVVENLGGVIGEGKSLFTHKTAKALISVEAMLFPTLRAPYSTQRARTQDALKRWTDNTYENLSGSFIGAYVNYASTGIKDWEEQYYGREAYDQLIKIKSQVRDSEIFDGPQRIRTEAMDQRHGDATVETDKASDTGSENALQERYQGLNRQELQSSKSALCPQWLLNTAIPILPSEITSIENEVISKPHEVMVDENEIKIEEVYGKNVVFVGGSSGIGFAAVLQLLRMGANVIATSRTQQKCDETQSIIVQIFTPLSPSKTGKFTCMTVSLDDAASVQQMAASISAHFGLRPSPVDILILCAAQNGTPEWSHNMAGVPKAVAVNHLGPFGLTLLLLQNSLLNIETGRVIVQASGAAFKAEETDMISLAVQREDDADGPNGLVKTINPDSGSFADDAVFRTYAATKAMNVAFALELARRLRSTKTHGQLHVFLSLPPGTVNTTLAQYFLTKPNYRQEILDLMEGDILSPAEAALSIVYASSASLDVLDYPPMTRFTATEDFAHSTRAEMLGVEKVETRRLHWEHEKQPAISSYVLGCQVGSIAARFRRVSWMRTNTTCNLWNWGVEMVNNATRGAIMMQPGQSPLGDLFVEDCHLLL